MTTRAPRDLPRGARPVYLTTVPFLALHSFSVESTQPLPLQSFMPLQELFADLQAPLPLQSLMPMQWTLSLSAALTTAGAPAVNRPATAAATNAPFIVIEPSFKGNTAGTLCRFRSKWQKNQRGRIGCEKTDHVDVDVVVCVDVVGLVRLRRALAFRDID